MPCDARRRIDALISMILRCDDSKGLALKIIPLACFNNRESLTPPAPNQPMLYRQHNRFLHRHARWHWACRCLVFFLLLLVGCTPAQPAPSGVLPPISIVDAQLRSGGSAFEVRGVNYIHPSTADLSKCAALQFGA